MRNFVLIPLLCGIAYLVPSPADAQQKAPLPPLPSGPLINRLAPDFSQWLISVTHETTDISKNLKPKKYDSRTLVRKTGSIRNEIAVTSDGKAESWFEYGWEAKILPGGKDPQVYMKHGQMFNPFEDHSKSDFVGFDWISKHTYAGIQNVMGMDCIVFHKDGSSDDDGTAPRANAGKDSGTTAYIAEDTRLPVLLKEDDATTFYEFQNPPSAMLTVPPNFQAAFDDVRGNMQRAAMMKPAAP